MKTFRRLALLATAAIPLFTASAWAKDAKTLKVLLIDSPDGDFIASVYGEILKSLGDDVKYVTADYAASYTAIQKGDIDVSLAAWQTTGKKLTADALASKQVLSYGPTGVLATEGWWYPAYLETSCPGLPDWHALQGAACIKALSTPDTDPNGRFVDAPADWGEGNPERIKSLGLKLEAVNSGSPAALIATVKGAAQRKQPVIGWGFLPQPYLQQVKGDFVALPGFERNLDILKLAYKPTADTSPLAMAVLKKFHLPTTDVAIYMGKISSGMSLADAAHDWMKSHPDVWRKWAS